MRREGGRKEWAEEGREGLLMCLLIYMHLLSTTDLQHRNTFVRAHRPYGVSCVIVGMASSSSSSPSTTASSSSSSSSSSSISPCIYATEPSGVVQEYRAVCVGENADAITTRLETHSANLSKMNVGQLVRFAARVLWDARAEAAGGGGEKEEGKEEGREEGVKGKVELEVLLLTWEGGQGEDEAVVCEELERD